MTSLIRAFRLGLVNVDFVRQVLLKDARAGFVLGIVALPMSLGIALASGFPPFAGLLSSLVGGLVLSFFSGSRLGIKGPAGGLSALTLSCVIVMGNGNLSDGYALTLAVIIVSGILQVVSSFAKMGNLGDFFPASAIHGMLAALGFIMVVKQLPPLLGAPALTNDTLGLLAEFPKYVSTSNPKIVLIGLGCLLLLAIHHYLPKKVSNYLPSVILMLALVVPIAYLLHLPISHSYIFGGHEYRIDPQLFLVQFPSDFVSSLRLPSFDKIHTVEFWFFATALSLAGNIESLLTCKSIDQSDPWHRQSDFNRDLFAIGMGNVICGFCGGLPIISESKRSIINIHMGAVSFASNFFHALFLLAIILFAQPFIRLIPVSALAAFLIFTGIKMTMPSEFSKSYKIGKEQFLVFIIVFVLTIFSNFLVGVVVGTLFELIVNVRFGAKWSSLFTSNINIVKESALQYNVALSGPAIFSNFLWVKSSLHAIPKSANVVIDFTKATVVDHSFMENLSFFDATRKKSGGSLLIVGLDYHEQVSSHPLAARRIVQTEVTARQKDLAKYAESLELDFDGRRITNISKYNSFDLLDRIQVVHQQNLIKSVKGECSIEIADVHFELNGVNKQFFDATVLVVYNLPISCPDFILQKEGFQGGLLSIENSKDFNFEQYPVFSYYYYLTGQEEDLVRDFFDEDLILFFEKNKGYNLNMSERDLLIYKRTDVLAGDEIERMRQFAEELIVLLDSKK